MAGSCVSKLGGFAGGLWARRWWLQLRRRCSFTFEQKKCLEKKEGKRRTAFVHLTAAGLVSVAVHAD